MYIIDLVCHFCGLQLHLVSVIPNEGESSHSYTVLISPAHSLSFECGLPFTYINIHAYVDIKFILLCLGGLHCSAISPWTLLILTKRGDQVKGNENLTVWCGDWDKTEKIDKTVFISHYRQPGKAAFQ